MHDVQRAFGKIGLPMILIFLFSLGCVLMMQNRAVSSIQSAMVPSRPSPQEDVLHFDPFVIHDYQSSNAPQARTDVQTGVLDAPARGAYVTEVSKSPSFDSVVTDVQRQQLAAPAKTFPSVQSPAIRTESLVSAATGDTFLPSATINVGNADIYVTSSFKIFYGGTLIATGTNTSNP